MYWPPKFCRHHTRQLEQVAGFLANSDDKNKSRRKPFHRYYYNLPKLGPLPKMKKINYKTEPKSLPRGNRTTELRKKLLLLKVEKEIDNELPKKVSSNKLRKYRALAKRNASYRRNIVSAFRWKWTRKIPIISRYFQRHVLEFRKPPFEIITGRLKCWEFSPINPADVTSTEEYRKKINETVQDESSTQDEHVRSVATEADESPNNNNNSTSSYPEVVEHKSKPCCPKPTKQDFCEIGKKGHGSERSIRI